MSVTTAPKRTRRREYETAWQREFRKTEKGRLHVRRMNLRKYGLSVERYNEMLAAQGGCCAACRLPETGRNQYGTLPLAVDHDHTTGQVRGLLCMRCNRALGLLQDDLMRIQQLLIYRRAH